MMKWIVGLFIAFVIYTFLAASFQLPHPVMHLVRHIPYGDKVTHFFLIGGLAFATNFFLKKRAINIKGRNILLGSFLIFVIITFEEFSQIWIAHRNFDLLDLASNYLGIFIIGTLGIRYFLNPPPKPTNFNS